MKYDILLSILVVVVFTLVPLAVALTHGAWQKDCESMGYSRVGDKVYTCSLKK